MTVKELQEEIQRALDAGEVFANDIVMVEYAEQMRHADRLVRVNPEFPAPQVVTIMPE